MNLRWIKVKIDKNYILLVIILLIGSFLRFYNLNWDDMYVFHPDELNIDIAVSKIRFFSQLNPHFFQYNGLSIYLYRATGELLRFISQNDSWVKNFGNINLIGRFYSALFSSITVFLIYKLSFMLFNSKKTALLTSLFLSLTVSLIQSAHFAVTESLLIFFLVLIAILTTTFLKSPSFKNIILLGIASGMALAVKTTALSFLIFSAIALIICFFQKKQFFHFKKIAIFCLVFLFATFLSFFLFSPYSFIAWKSYSKGMLSEQKIITGKTMVHWNFQFLHTKPYLFQIKNLFWQMGPILPFTSLIGFIFYCLLFFKFKNRKIIPLLIWTWAYFLTIGSLFVKYVRYFNLLLPSFCLFSAFFLSAIRKKNKLIGKLLMNLTIITTSLYAFAFFSIYLKEQTRITASKWIFNNIPEKSKLLKEDEHLPIYLRNYPTKHYETLNHYPLFAPDNNQKLNSYIQNLSRADYIIISTRRTYAVISRLKNDFPLSSYYYEQLFNGNLGYQKIAEFPSYPSLFGFQLNDDSAEETFQVFDHPKPIIFKNVERKSAEEIRKILQKSFYL